MNQKRSLYLGFSLIELMVVVVILGILTAIAIPSYQGYIRSSRTSEAQTNISSIAQYEEQYYSENNKYMGLGGTPNPAYIPSPNDNGGALLWDTTIANWSELGTIFANTTYVRFQYRVFAGQFDATGTDPTTPLASHVKSNTTMGLNNGTNGGVTTAGYNCNGNLNSARPIDFGVTASAYANWFVVTAVGNQYCCTSGSTGNRNRCSLFVKVNDRPAIYKYDETE